MRPGGHPRTIEGVDHNTRGDPPGLRFPMHSEMVAQLASIVARNAATTPAQTGGRVTAAMQPLLGLGHCAGALVAGRLLQRENEQRRPLLDAVGSS